MMRSILEMGCCMSGAKTSRLFPMAYPDYEVSPRVEGGLAVFEHPQY